jgi:hypothetical protein
MSPTGREQVDREHQEDEARISTASTRSGFKVVKAATTNSVTAVVTPSSSCSRDARGSDTPPPPAAYAIGRAPMPRVH